ncbi:PREDICTED: uncharacterized protein K02A2.6-like, partial [Paramuricea clavata]
RLIQTVKMIQRSFQNINIYSEQQRTTISFIRVYLSGERYQQSEIVKSTKATTVIPKLDKIFATHGIPPTVKSDNGPPFNREEYSRYLKAFGIKPVFSTPLYPQGNAEVEQFMQPLGKTLKAAKIEGHPWHQVLNRFLLQYHNPTFHHWSTTSRTVNRTVKGKLPVLQKWNMINLHRQARQNEESKKEYSKKYADNKRNVKKNDIKVAHNKYRHIITRN